MRFRRRPNVVDQLPFEALVRTLFEEMTPEEQRACLKAARDRHLALDFYTSAAVEGSPAVEDAPRCERGPRSYTPAQNPKAG